ncbi:MAG: nitroreductase [Ulvibacter sp.]|jgi:nitroreductase
MESIKIKAAKVNTDIHPLIQERWSPLAFSNKKITEEQIEELFEAASWAASAYNEQPWEYIYAHRGTDGFEKLWSCLAEGNQPWTKEASIIFVAIKRDNFSANGNPNPWAAHDLGMANAQLLLQAIHRDIYGHFMAGFDAGSVRQSFDLEDNVSPVCMGVLGYLGEPEDLGDAYKSRELSVRSRKPLSEFTKKV